MACSPVSPVKMSDFSPLKRWEMFFQLTGVVLKNFRLLQFWPLASVHFDHFRTPHSSTFNFYYTRDLVSFTQQAVQLNVL